MENLIKCSNVLYDKDISSKMATITSLEKKLSIYEPQKIEYFMDEWKTIKEEAFLIIKNGVNKWIIENEFEYKYMSQYGITSRQKVNISLIIEEAVNLLLKESNKTWAYHVSNTIIIGIDNFFSSFIKTGIWNNIYSQLNPNTMAIFIYNNIILQLDNGGEGCGGGVSRDCSIYL